MTIYRSFVATLAAVLLILQVASPVVAARQYGPAEAQLLTPLHGELHWLECDAPGTGERATHCLPPSIPTAPHRAAAAAGVEPAAGAAIACRVTAKNFWACGPPAA